ncbi:MAG: nicotinate-nucleotide--dimethylbenzimidazole phosphoribosyltransferase [Candidatus Obscuribacterales bacterium]|nr:nicotinate-nucleotide--dimethylbenzimidazole phosphoribosyltransferase [Candidatus Obscuribacterales bacterium]
MPYSIINDPDSRMSALFEHAKSARRIKFVLCVGGTKTSDIDGLSGAGATPQDRRATPRCDAEALINGIAGKTSALPVSPEGIVSPVVITSACLKLLNVPVTIVDCGAFDSPREGTVIQAGNSPADCLSTGAAMDLKHVESLFQTGKKLGEQLSPDCDLMIVAECVPAGTSTAFAVLTALGYDVQNSVSSSVPNLNHDIRWKLASAGLGRSGLTDLIQTGDPIGTQRRLRQPLRAVAAVGDPMQPVAAGILLAAATRSKVILGGGSQMLAVFSLARALSRDPAEIPYDGEGSHRHFDEGPWSRYAQEDCPGELPEPCASSSAGSDIGENTSLIFSAHTVGVVTTSWVAYDKNARVSDIAKTVEAPFACSMLDFHKSAHAGLRAYEDGHVKEGVGAGASIVLAHLLRKYSNQELIDAIDRAYADMVPGDKVQS